MLIRVVSIQIAAVFKIGSSREVPSIPEFLSEDAKMFLRSCLQRDPLARPTAAELLEHPFVRIAEKLQPNVLSEVVRSGQKATPRSGISPRSPRRGEMKLLNVMECGPESGQYSSPGHGNSDWWNGSNTARRQDGEVIQEPQRGSRPQPLRFGNTARSNNHTQQQHIPLERSPRQHQSYALWDGSSPLPHVPVDDNSTLGEARTMRSPQRLKL
jgi:serine/threonine protein kinase